VNPFKGRNFVKDFLDETYHYPTFRKGDLDNVREACKNPSCVKQKLKAITCCHQIQNLNRKMQEDNKQIENEQSFSPFCSLADDT
jgi:hypothetical protein